MYIHVRVHVARCLFDTTSDYCMGHIIKYWTEVMMNSTVYMYTSTLKVHIMNKQRVHTLIYMYTFCMHTIATCTVEGQCAHVKC